MWSSPASSISTSHSQSCISLMHGYIHILRHQQQTPTMNYSAFHVYAESHLLEFCSFGYIYCFSIFLDTSFARSLCTSTWVPAPHDNNFPTLSFTLMASAPPCPSSEHISTLKLLNSTFMVATVAIALTNFVPATWRKTPIGKPVNAKLKTAVNNVEKGLVYPQLMEEQLNIIRTVPSIPWVILELVLMIW